MKLSKLPGKKTLYAPRPATSGIQNFGNGCRDCLHHANLARAYVCLMKQICNHRITCHFSPTGPLPCSVLRMVLLTECSISHHFFSFHYHSSCFPIPSYSLPLYLVHSIRLLPAWITLEVPNCTVLTTLAASDVLSLAFL